MNRQNVALSGIAMILIVLNHTIHLEFEYAAALGYSQNFGLNYYILWISQALGSFAVPIFLFISGSFVAYAAKGDPPKVTIKISTIKFASHPHAISYMVSNILFYAVCEPRNTFFFYRIR